MNAPKLRAGIYVRVSKDKRKGRLREGASVDQQESEARLAAAALGAEVVEVYCDNDQSASRYARKTRKHWDRLVADIAADKIDILIMWEPSRGSRKLSTWAVFLDLLVEHDVPVHIVSHDTTYDARKSRDWKALADDGVDSAAEVDRTSDRIKRDKAYLRAEGRPDGKLVYGYAREYDPASGDLVRQYPHPTQAPIATEIIKRASAAEPISAIARDLERRRILPDSDPKRAPSPKGAAWSRNTVRRIALNPVAIAKRYVPGTTELIDCNWDTIIDEDVWWTAQRVLTDETRRTTKPGRAKHLLSYIATCGVCAKPLAAAKIRRGQEYYYCFESKCVGIKKEWLDDYIVDLIVERFSKPDVTGAVTAGSDADAIAARARASQLRARLKDLWGQVKRGRLTSDEYVDAKAEIQPQIDDADQQATEAGTPPQLRALAALVKTGDVETVRKLVRAAWKAMPLGARRDAIRLAFDYIRVNRATVKSLADRVSGLDTSRVAWDWRRKWGVV